MTWTHEHSWKVAATPEATFGAFTDPTQLTKWFAEHAEVGDRVGRPYRFWGRRTLGIPSADQATQALTLFEPPRRLGFSWRIRDCPTEVTVAFAAEGDGCRLTLHHRVDGDLGGPRQKELIDDHWRLGVGNLMSHLSGGQGLLLPDYADPAPEVRFTITIEAPCEAVWRALIEPEALKRWVGSPGRPTVEPRVGGRYEYGWSYQIDGKTVAGGPTRILEIVPGRKLVVDWPDWRGDPAVSAQHLTWLLEPAGAHTRLTFVHGGFGRTTDLSDYPFGWVHFLGELTQVSLTLSQGA
ncbi:MAG: SRPBCC domain-containing protein [Gemmatimonadales bacterium]